MSGLVQKRGKSENDKKIFGDNKNEGTAARTRPFTFEEIMQKRKTYILNAEGKSEAGNLEDFSRKGNDKEVTNHSEPDGRNGELMSHVSGDTVKRSSTEKRESSSWKEAHLVERKGEENSDAEKLGNYTKERTSSHKKRSSTEKVSSHSEPGGRYGHSTSHIPEDTVEKISTEKLKSSSLKEAHLLEGKGKEKSNAEILDKDTRDSVSLHKKRSSTEKVSNHSELDVRYGDITSSVPEDTVKRSSTEKLESSSLKEVHLVKGKNKENCDAEKIEKDTRDRDNWPKRRSSIEEVFNHSEPDGRYNGLTGHVSENTGKRSSEINSLKEDHLVKGKGKETSDVEAKLADKLDDDTRDRDKLHKQRSSTVSNHFEPDGRYSDLTSHVSENTAKRSSPDKQESTSVKEDHLVRGKGKESFDAEVNLAEKLDDHTRDRDKSHKKRSSTVSNRFEPDGRFRELKSSEKTAKESSREKQERTSLKEGHFVKGNGKEKSDAEADETVKLDDDMRDRAKLHKKRSSIVSNHLESDGRYGELKSHDSESTVKRSSRREHESTSLKEGHLLQGKGNRNSDAEANLMENLDNDTRDRTKLHNKRSSTEKVTYHSELDGGGRDLKSHVSENTSKRSSGGKQESTSVKEGHFVEGKVKENFDAEANLEEKLGKDSRIEAKGHKKDKRSNHRDRKEERSRDDFENEPERKRAGNSVRKERYEDTNKRKSENEGKRRERSRDDGKIRLEVEEKAAKKHDSGKGYNLEAAGRKDRKSDSSRSHNEEVREKRRRSRSRDKRDRDRKSASLSPRAHKRSSYHSSKDRKSFSDVDRNKTSTNGGHGSSYHRHGGHGSRLGGYSPRKRRSEAAVKTPSPTIRSPERKAAGWDLPPSGTDTRSATSMLLNFPTPHQIVSSSTTDMSAAVPPAPEPFSGASPDTLSVYKTASTDFNQVKDATQKLRRLYIENVPSSASDKSMIDHLNSLFLSSDACHSQGNPPCISCIINKEKGEALVEFLTPEDATIALSFDGRSFFGSILKLRRPNFVELPTGVVEKPVAVLDAVSDVVKDSPYKIFVGGIPKVLSSDMVLEIVSAFGTLKAYYFKANEETDEACAFVEYLDKLVTVKACAGLNGMKLGGKVLTAIQATPNAPIEDTSEVPPHYEIPDLAKPLLSNPTNVLKLKNVLNPEELSTLSGLEIEEVLEDIRFECARYGSVKSVNVVRRGTDCETAPARETNQADSTSDSQHIDESNLNKGESTKEDIDTYNGDNCRLEALYGAENDGLNHDKDTEDHIESSHINSSIALDVSTNQMDIDTNPQDPSDQSNATKDQLTNCDDKLSDPHNEDTLMVEDQSKPEEATKGDLQEASIESNKTSSISDTNWKAESKKEISVLEEGCVLVEFARTEASSIAAHCLHGRLYADRTVVVGYVDHDLYMSRFPK